MRGFWCSGDIDSSVTEEIYPRAVLSVRGRYSMVVVTICCDHSFFSSYRPKSSKHLTLLLNLKLKGLCSR